MNKDKTWSLPLKLSWLRIPRNQSLRQKPANVLLATEKQESVRKNVRKKGRGQARKEKDEPQGFISRLATA